jgi:hypothetical protein
VRALRPDEIECRVNIINEKGLSLLLYKNARTDMNILDEVYPERWACEYREIKGNLFCGISVLINNEWVTRWDCGVESREDGNGNEKKGEASDSFKRAGTKWGIGRELYTAPKLIWIKACDFTAFDNKGKKATYDTFSVIDIGVKDGNITSLKIVNDKTQRVVYVLGTGVNPATVKTEQNDIAEKEKSFIAEFDNLQKELTVYLNTKGIFEHPENVRQVIAAKDVKQMKIALSHAKANEKMLAEKAKKPTPAIPENLF